MYHTNDFHSSGIGSHDYRTIADNETEAQSRVPGSRPESTIGDHDEASGIDSTRDTRTSRRVALGTRPFSTLITQVVNPNQALLALPLDEHEQTPSMSMRNHIDKANKPCERMSVETGE
jgi:hypothetical protein